MRKRGLTISQVLFTIVTVSSSRERSMRQSLNDELTLRLELVSESFFQEFECWRKLHDFDLTEFLRRGSISPRSGSSETETELFSRLEYGR
jgi:hypothetical protein